MTRHLSSSRAKLLHDTTIDVLDFLTRLEVRNVKKVGSEAVFSCPFPGHKHADQTPSASMNLETTAWLCFGCHRRGNAVTFLSDLESVTVGTAIRWIREAYGGAFAEPADGMRTEIDRILSSVPALEAVDATNPPIDEAWVDRFLIDWDKVAATEDAPWQLRYMIDRGFDPGTLNYFQFGYEPLDERIVIPVRDEKATLVGLKGRACGANRVPKYKGMGDGQFPFRPYKMGRVVFGAFDCRPRNGHVIVCEGELNAVRMRQFGYDNAVAISGAAITSTQVDIVTWIADTVVLYFDCDEAGSAGHRLASRLFQEKGIRVFSVPEHDKDAADSTKAEVDDLVEARFSETSTII